MKVDAYSVFVNMFQALDALWEERHDVTLAGFLSEASPFTFDGKGSADPAVWAGFSEGFGKRFPDGAADLSEARDFVCCYLGGISDEYSGAYPGGMRLDDAFREAAPPDRWAEAFEPCPATEGD